MKTTLHLLSAAFASLVLAPGAGSALVEGFETRPGSVLGDASLVGASFFDPATPPPQGNSQLLLTTLASGSDGGNVSGSDAVSIASAETFLNLQAGAIPDGGSAGDASAVKFMLALNAGEIVSFQYKFLTSAIDGDGADFAFYTLQSGSGIPTLQTFAEAAVATNSSTTALFDFESGTFTVNLDPVAVSGIYTLGFGVADHTDDVIQSGVLIDNVQVVPEPSSLLLLLAVGCGVLLRRRGGK